MDFMDIVTKSGAVLSLISAAIALIALFKSNASKYIARQSGKEEREKADKAINERLDGFEDKMSQFLTEFDKFRNQMDGYIDAQRETSKKMLASIIEATYYENRQKKSLDMNEFKRITEVYDVYHSDEIHGNNYITAIYEEMLNWDRKD